MRIFRQVTVLCFLTFILACKQAPKEDAKSVADAVDTKTEKVITKSEAEPSIDSYSEFPDEITGCACSFSANRNEFDEGNYIYTSNFTNMAMLKLDGEMVAFEKMRTSESDKDENIKVWFNKERDYKLTLETWLEEQADEIHQYNGVLILQSKQWTKRVKGVFGECGC